MKKFISLFSVLLFLFVPISVTAAANENAEGIIVTSAAPLAVSVNAKACILMDVATGTVLTSMNEHEKLFPASITKVMTLLLICEAIEAGKLTLDMEITCSASAAEKGGSQIWLEAGEVMTVNELLKAAVVYSANDACCLLAETVAGSEEAFCSLMNTKAKELGMNNTHFDNCSGLDDDTQSHKSTAYDIALMSRALLQFDLIRNYTSIWMDSLRNGETQLINTNKLIRTYPGATGLKTGTTSKAGCCVSASAERDGMELVAVVLGADTSKDRFNGAAALLDWGFANFEIYSPDATDYYPEKIKVIHGVKQEIKLFHENSHPFIIKKGTADKITYEAVIDENIEAPVEKNQQLGKIIIKADTEIIGECLIKSAEESQKMTFGKGILALLGAFCENL